MSTQQQQDRLEEIRKRLTELAGSTNPGDILEIDKLIAEAKEHGVEYVFADIVTVGGPVVGRSLI